MAKRGQVGSLLSGLKNLGEALSALKRGRVDLGFFAGDAARSMKGGAGSKPGFYLAGTAKETIAALKVGRTVAAQTNPELAAKHEFGLGVPQRSMLRMPLHLHGDKILKAAQADARASLAEVAKHPKRAATKLLQRLALGGENLVQEAFATRGFGSWKANSPVTIAIKGSDAPLIDTAQLRRAVASRVVA